MILTNARRLTQYVVDYGGRTGHPGNHTDIRSQIESGPGKYENNLLKIWDIDILSSDDVLS